ncbi:hypothetical protein BU16DRAFT_45730 [Lophium mytilinum]|uniref:Uncharacterized protein n=1 Tax=Lophium mytilinum TaxID=390894 RepID=A0A6A6QRD2_9PEZI|nr:hypothetical protein BU16DRAFT_45730 [Lophium mytilinum]
MDVVAFTRRPETQPILERPAITTRCSVIRRYSYPVILLSKRREVSMESSTVPLDRRNSISPDFFEPSPPQSRRPSLWIGGDEEAERRRDQLRALDIARLKHQSIASTNDAAPAESDSQRSSVQLKPYTEPTIQALQRVATSDNSEETNIYSHLIRRVSRARNEVAPQPTAKRMTSELARRRLSSQTIPEGRSLSPIQTLSPAELTIPGTFFPGNTDSTFQSPSRRHFSISMSPSSSRSPGSIHSTPSDVTSFSATIPPPSPLQFVWPLQPPSARSPTRSRSENPFSSSITTSLLREERDRVYDRHSLDSRSLSVLLCQSCFSRDSTFNRMIDGLCEVCGEDKVLDQHYWERKQ